MAEALSLLTGVAQDFVKRLQPSGVWLFAGSTVGSLFLLAGTQDRWGWRPLAPVHEVVHGLHAPDGWLTAVERWAAAAGHPFLVRACLVALLVLLALGALSDASYFYQQARDIEDTNRAMSQGRQWSRSRSPWSLPTGVSSADQQRERELGAANAQAIAAASEDHVQAYLSGMRRNVATASVLLGLVGQTGVVTGGKVALGAAAVGLASGVATTFGVLRAGTDGGRGAFGLGVMTSIAKPFIVLAYMLTAPLVVAFGLGGLVLPRHRS